MKIGSPNVTDGGKFQARRQVKKIPLNDSWTGRIVAGPVKRHWHFWPTRAMDKTTQVEKSTWKSVIVNPNESNILDRLAAVDKALKQKALVASGGDPKKAKSLLAKGDRFDYAMIIRNTGKPPIVEIVEANWTVFDAINQLKTKKDPNKPDYLLNGLPFMYDVIIERRIKPTTGQPDYSVSIHPATLRTSGMVHSGFLDQDKNPFPNPEQFFSAEDLAAIQACPFELADLDKPMSPEQVIDVVRDYPIDLNHRLKENNSIFTFFNRMEDLLAIQEFSKTSGTHFFVPNETDLLRMGYSNFPPPPAGQMALPGAQGTGKAVDAQFSVVPPHQETAPAFTPATPTTPYPQQGPAYPPAGSFPAPAGLAAPIFPPPSAGAPVFNTAGTEYHSPIPNFPNVAAPAAAGPAYPPAPSFPAPGASFTPAGVPPAAGSSVPPAGAPNPGVPPWMAGQGAPPMAERVAPVREGAGAPGPVFPPPVAPSVAPPAGAATLARPTDLW